MLLNQPPSLRGDAAIGNERRHFAKLRHLVAAVKSRDGALVVLHFTFPHLPTELLRQQFEATIAGEDGRFPVLRWQTQFNQTPRLYNNCCKEAALCGHRTRP